MMDKYIQVGKPFIPYNDVYGKFRSILENEVFILEDIQGHSLLYFNGKEIERAFDCFSLQYAIQELKKKREKIDARIAYLEKELLK